MDTTKKTSREDAIDPWNVIHLFRDHMRIVVGCVLVGGLAAAAFVYHRVPAYVSRAVLEVSSEPQAFGDTQNRDSDINSAALLKTIEQTVASQAVVKRVIDKLDLAGDPTFAPPRKGKVYSDTELIGLLQSRIAVSLIRGTRLISVEVRDASPIKAQAFAENVLGEFFAQNLETHREGANATRQYLLAEAKRVEAELHASEERLQAYREKYNSVSLSDQHDSVTERLNDLSRQVMAARAERLALEADQAAVRTLLNQGPEHLLAVRSIAALPDVVELRKQLSAQQADVAALALRYRDLHPSMIQARRVMSETQASLNDMLEKGASGIIQAYQTAKANEESLAAELARQEKMALDLGRLSISYRALQREVESNSALYQQVLARLKGTDVSQGMTTTSNIGGGSLIQVVAPPLLPAAPTGVSSKLLIVFGLFGGGVAGIGIVLTMRALDTSLPSLDDAESFLGVPSLAVVPRMSLPKGKDEFVVATHPCSVEAEAFRSLRTSLLLLRPEGTGQLVMFTSAVPGEGKSFCSANYAASLAQQGLRTLLIDGDLRRSTLRQAYVKANKKPGLTDCLKDPALLDEAINETAVPNLFLLGDSHGSSTGAELLSGPGLKVLLDKSAAQFDRVVVDTAPLTAVSDTLHIAKHVATICLVLHAGQTPRRAVRRACTLLTELANTRPAGVILNQVKPGRVSSYYYYSNSNYYYGHPPVSAVHG
jgi:capsular exopolysaccharide synthesis family protein